MQLPYRVDILHIMVAVMPLPTPGVVGVVSAQRTKKQGAFDTSSENRLQAYLSHFRSLFLARRRLDTTERRAADLEAMLNELPRVILQVDAGGRVLYVNEPARVLLTANQGKGDGITFSSGGRLGAETHADTLHLHSQIARACGGSDSSALLLPRSSGFAPLQLVIVPLRIPGQSPAGRALVLVQDVATNGRTLADLLIQLYRLSHSEAALVVDLASGGRLDRFSDRHGISLHTARTLLKRALDKTGVRRQSALVGLVKTVPVPRGWERGR